MLMAVSLCLQSTSRYLSKDNHWWLTLILVPTLATTVIVMAIGNQLSLNLDAKEKRALLSCYLMDKWCKESTNEMAPYSFLASQFLSPDYFIINKISKFGVEPILWLYCFPVLAYCSFSKGRSNQPNPSSPLIVP